VAFVDDEPGAYSVLRTGGKMVQETSAVASFPRPAKPLELYEFQGCPFCKRVRECLVTLDLDAVYYPCPRDGPNWRPKAVAEGGKKQFPLFRDPNTGVSMYESADIVAYLAKTYGDGTVPAGLDWPVAPALLGFALLPRMGRGSKYRRSRVTADTKPLTLWAYEASPFCVIVREALNELEIPHLLKTAARGSPKRQQLLELTGTFQVPYLEECVRFSQCALATVAWSYACACAQPQHGQGDVRVQVHHRIPQRSLRHSRVGGRRSVVLLLVNARILLPASRVSRAPAHPQLA
jgi:glutathione S-transferase